MGLVLVLLLGWSKGRDERVDSNMDDDHLLCGRGLYCKGYTHDRYTGLLCVGVKLVCRMSVNQMSIIVSQKADLLST